MTNPLNNNQIKKIFDIAIEAGQLAISAFYDKNYSIEIKNDKSQVTSIDIKISKFITENLRQLFPKIPIICEEGDKIKIEGDIFFVVDPIDGTSSFINGEDEFSINIALIYQQKSVFGLIYAPLFEGGKMIFNDEKDQVYHYNHELNCEQIINPQKNKSNIINVITSKKVENKIIDKFLKENFINYNNYNLLKFSSAVKFIIVAESRANLYLHLRRSMEWDTASGQVIMELLGAEVNIIEINNFDYIITKNNLNYHKKDFINPFFIVSFCKI